MKWRELERLGEPDVVIGGLKIWVHGRQFPDAEDYWDGNWLRAIACCSSPGAIVCTEGPIIHLGEIHGFLHGCRKLYESLSGEAALACIEPNLSVKLSAEWNGALAVHIKISPDQMTERHSFEESLDQTYLPSVIAQCVALLEKFPVREPESLPSQNAA
jgi:hypothetical protein